MSSRSSLLVETSSKSSLFIDMSSRSSLLIETSSSSLLLTDASAELLKKFTALSVLIEDVSGGLIATSLGCSRRDKRYHCRRLLVRGRLTLPGCISNLAFRVHV